MSDYTLTYTELKERAGIGKDGQSESTIHRLIQFCHIPRKKVSRGYRYNNKSVEKLKLCIILNGFGKTIQEMNLIFENNSLASLKKKLARISFKELSDLIIKVKKKNK